MITAKSLAARAEGEIEEEVREEVEEVEDCVAWSNKVATRAKWLASDVLRNCFSNASCFFTDVCLF